jgi:hypothetical protein
MSIADANMETPAKAKPPYKLPVLWLINPIAYGPANSTQIRDRVN